MRPAERQRALTTKKNALQTVSGVMPCTTTVVAVFVTTAFTFSFVVLSLFALRLAILVPRLGFAVFALSLTLSTSFVLCLQDFGPLGPFPSDSNHHGLQLDQSPWAWPRCRGYPLGPLCLSTIPLQDLFTQVCILYIVNCQSRPCGNRLSTVHQWSSRPHGSVGMTSLLWR